MNDILLVTFFSITGIYLLVEGIVEIFSPHIILNFQVLIIEKVKRIPYGIFLVFWGNVLIFFTKRLEIYRILLFILSLLIIVSGLIFLIENKNDITKNVSKIENSTSKNIFLVFRVEGIIKFAYAVLIFYTVAFHYRIYLF